MLPIAIGVILILLTFFTNYSQSSISLKFYLNSFEQLTYHFGVSATKFISKDSSSPHTLTILSLGLIFIDIECHFIRKINLEES